MASRHVTDRIGSCTTSSSSREAGGCSGIHGAEHCSMLQGSRCASRARFASAAMMMWCGVVWCGVSEGEQSSLSRPLSAAACAVAAGVGFVGGARHHREVRHRPTRLCNRTNARRRRRPGAAGSWADVARLWAGRSRGCFCGAHRCRCVHFRWGSSMRSKRCCSHLRPLPLRPSPT